MCGKDFFGNEKRVLWLFSQKRSETPLPPNSYASAGSKLRQTEDAKSRWVF